MLYVERTILDKASDAPVATMTFGGDAVGRRATLAASPARNPLRIPQHRKAVS